MKERFNLKLGLNKSNTERLQVINNILEEYEEQGYILTLRQLYYQLVSRDIIPNQPKEYAKLSILLTKGRMAGIVDWAIIEDRVRRPILPYYVSGITEAIEDTINQYRLDRQKGQDYYIELWIEKDALSGVLKKITTKYHIRLMVNRGYSSTTAMYDASKRLKEAYINNNQRGIILYLGDHDPSGLDMVRDIKERLEDFEVEDVEVLRIGLTQKQIKTYNPPPNPAKIKDPRAKEYIKNYGNTSWEVDALTPQVLNKLVDDNILTYINLDLYNDVLLQEKKDIIKLRQFGEDFESD